MKKLNSLKRNCSSLSFKP